LPEIAQSDFYVCPECGSLRECPHDDEYNSHPLNSSAGVNHDLCYEMVSNTEILPGEEVFNAYGARLSNAELFLQYGFVLDPNDNDVVHLSEIEITRLFASFCNEPVAPPPLSGWRIAPLKESLTTSILVSGPSLPRAEGSLYIDSDGKISVQLWIFIVQIIWKNKFFVGPLSESELIDLATTQSHMENVLHGSRSARLDDSDESNAEASLRFQVLVELARTLIRLCENKKETIGHPLFKDQDFGEILDVSRLCLTTMVIFGSLSFIFRQSPKMRAD